MTLVNKHSGHLPIDAMGFSELKTKWITLHCKKTTIYLNVYVMIHLFLFAFFHVLGFK